MPEYLTPGVYVEEFEMGARPIEGVSTSTTGFLGLTERGPVSPPRLVTSPAQFNRIYGSYIIDSYMAYAVDGFFANGGQRCYIGRIVRDEANEASLVEGNINFKSVGPGKWGKRVGIRIQDASSDPGNNKPDGQKVFKLTVAYWSEQDLPSEDDFKLPDNDDLKNKKLMNITEKAYIETYDELSEDENSVDHYLKKFSESNPDKSLSNLILIAEESTGRPSNTEDEGVFFKLLSEDGEDGTGDLTRANFRGDPTAQPGEKRGLTAFEEVDDISIVYVPDLHFVKEDERSALYGDILTHCETLKDRFAILDAPKGERNIGGLMITSFATPSKYGAIYYPWIKIADPLTKKQELKPPGGYIAGIYARSDTERGVHKAPANEKVRGAIDLEFTLTKRDQGILNPRGINVIRNFPERGILVWGARTCIIDPLWKYINVRRLFIYVEESIEKGTQWAVFEPNDEKLWARVRATITQFLTRVWKDGALMGTKVEEAFFVKCDRSTMTQDDIDNGRLICVIGIAPVKPAEFVIFRIAQWAGGSSATE